MDGVPAFTLCPIPPDYSFTYQFKAELYDSTWYHAHYPAQYVDGAGPLIVHGLKNMLYDVDLGPIVLSDWYHSSYSPIVQSIVTPSLNPPIPAIDSSLINGKMNFNCSQVPSRHTRANNAGLSKFKFQIGKTHCLCLSILVPKVRSNSPLAITS
jgi:FtsP/CotA-like multicopper oxidase with cupredoxin domain